jgi:hypothetical protein
MFEFKEATKTQRKARIALVGPSGSGKTYTALKLATAFGGPIAVVDTERESASLYTGSGGFKFQTLNLNYFDPRKFPDLMKAAASVCGSGTLIIDSFTSWWSGQGGMIEYVESLAQQSRSGNSFQAWGKAKPVEKALIDSLLAFPGHVIVTMRAKTEYVIEEDEKGKKTPRKLGMAPEQRGSIEYEFDIVGDMTNENHFVVSKSRCLKVKEIGLFRQPGEALAKIIKDWLNDGAAPAPAPAPAPAQPPPEPAKLTEAEAMLRTLLTNAASIEELNQHAPSIAQAHTQGAIDDDARKRLGVVYLQRKKTLLAESDAAAAVPVEPTPTEAA